METTTFKTLLAKDNVFGVTNILIPKIQRSYAQGRTDDRTAKTRTRFLGSIYDRVSADKTLTLDFVYGHVKEGCLIPLDGQQRLTTLWLLHWYAAKKENVDTDILDRFSYNTRYSARDFIKRMAAYTPRWNGVLSEEIQNEGWFPLDWANDPTVSGMFVTLDAIDKLFGNVDGLWDKLDLVNFYFLPLEELSLTDEVYIKMNSRGKPLTDFEHFKAELLKALRNIDDNGEETAKRIGRKIDIDWTNLLWNYRDSNNLVDDAFLRYFRIVCHLITYRDDRSFNDEIAGKDDFELIKEFFTGEDAYRNILYLESLFDCWVNVNTSTSKGDFSCGVEAFFNSYLSTEHREGFSMPLGNEIDLFRAGITTYPKFRNPNVLQWLTSFYAFLTFVRNRDTVSEADFRRRLRIIINLQANSKNEIVDTPKGDAGNRMPAILRQVEEILLSGKVERNISVGERERPTFNVSQLVEEADKLAFTTDNPTEAEPLFKLEDHFLLRGRTVAVGYRNTHLYQKFADLFNNCSWDAIDCGMLGVADYMQRRTKQTVQLGSGSNDDPGFMAWFELFHPTEKISNFEATARALQTILSETDCNDDAALYRFAEEYIAQCVEANRYDWRYYYLKYPVFRAERYGKYTMWADRPYELVAIYAPKYESNNAYQCFLRVIGDVLGKEIDDVRWLSYKRGWLFCQNDRFVYYNANGDKVLAELSIPQTDGMDTVDRIDYFLTNPL